MKLNRTGSNWDRLERNKINENWDIIEKSVVDAEDALINSEEALDKANEAIAKSDSTQTQLDTIVIEGDSSVEAAQARVDENGESHATLKARIDAGFEKTTQQLAHIVTLSPTPSEGNTAILQDFLDNIPNGTTIKIPKGFYNVEKNTELDGYPNNDQPCFVLRDKENIKIIGDGAHFKTNTHAQGIFEIKNCKNVTVEGITLEGRGDFLPLDGNTGYGEKGYGTGNSYGHFGGYYTAQFWGTHRNNSYDTSNRTGEGYGGTHPTTGTSRWGTHNGGFIGNVGSGLLIRDGSKNITINRVETYGFNYAGISAGGFGTGQYCENVTITNCYSHDNYGCNYNIHNVHGVVVDNNKSVNAGHPDHDVLSHGVVDPGYGIVLRKASNYADDVVITNNSFINDARKPIDAHAGERVIIKNNYINGGGCRCAIELYIDSTSQVQLSDLLVQGNLIENCISTHYTIGVNGTSIDERFTNGIIKDNTITNCIARNAIIRSYFMNEIIIESNVIKDINKTNIGTYELENKMSWLIAVKYGKYGSVKGNIMNAHDYDKIEAVINTGNFKNMNISSNIGIVKRPRNGDITGVKIVHRKPYDDFSLLKGDELMEVVNDSFINVISNQIRFIQNTSHTGKAIGIVGSQHTSGSVLGNLSVGNDDTLTHRMDGFRGTTAFRITFNEEGYDVVFNRGAYNINRDIGKDGITPHESGFIINYVKNNSGIFPVMSYIPISSRAPRDKDGNLVEYVYERTSTRDEMIVGFRNSLGEMIGINDIVEGSIRFILFF